MQRAQKLRMTGLAAVVLLAIAVPLGGAMAGPADAPMSDTSGVAGKAENSPSLERGVTGEMVGNADKKPFAALRSRAAADPLAGLDVPLLSGRTNRCGPELTSAEGVEVQTCVIAEHGRTWARTYYRNPTGDPLRAVLTLLRPDGRSVQVNCAVSASERPGVCETPAARTVHQRRTAYDAVAEVSDAAGERMLLRSGSNSAPGGRGSGR